MKLAPLFTVIFIRKNETVVFYASLCECNTIFLFFESKFTMIIEPGSFSSSSCLPVVGIVYYLIAVCCPSAALPNCSDEAEVKKFLMSEQYLALYSYYSNISDYNHSIPANISQCIENHDDKFSLDAEYILPKNNSYLKLIPPKICGKPAQADFHITVLSLDSIDESSMVRNFK